MARLNVPYVQRFEDRHGKVRHYFRRPGFKRVRLPDPAGPEFSEAYHKALGQTKKSIGAERVADGTLNALVVEYYGSGDFKNLKDSTQANYRNIFDRVRREYGHNPLAALDKAWVRQLLDDRSDTPGAARSLYNRMHMLMDFAVDRDRIAVSPFAAVKRPKIKSDGFAPWTDDDIAAFEKRWLVGTRARLAMALLLYTGQRRSDVVTMGRQHVKNGRINVVQEKTGTRLWIKLHPRLAAILDDLPKDNLTFLMTAYGKPMTPAGFTGWFGECANAAGLSKDKRPHGLRKAAARRLAEAGCSVKQIAAVTGHKSLAEVALYTDSADQERLADQAIEAIS